MQAVTQVDSAAVSLLLNWQRLAVQQSLTLSLQAMPDKLTRLLHLYNVEDLF
jgi:ABC-type transporter Mla MlaB component